MARHRRVTNLEEDKPKLSIAPLIDVCFLLLIYFLVTTTIKQKERDNSMALPSAAPSEAQPDIQPFFIKISNEGHIYANVGRYANMVKEMSKQVQFIYITHNKIAMEMADQLMGVTMHEPGCSRLVSVDVDEAAALAEA